MEDDTTRIEELEDGRVLERDLKSGRFTKSELPSDVASSMSKGLTRGQIEEDTNTLILEAGFTLENVPLAFRNVCIEVAKMGSKNMQATVQYNKWKVPQGGPEGVQQTVGEKCKACGRIWYGEEINLGKDAIAQLLSVMDIKESQKRPRIIGKERKFHG